MAHPYHDLSRRQNQAQQQSMSIFLTSK
jgi:hypothetical protein